MADEKNFEMNEAELEDAAGGYTGITAGSIVVGKSYLTQVSSGFLGLRSEPYYSDGNVFGQLWNGSVVIVTGQVIGNYVPVTVTYNAKGPYGYDSTGRVGYVDWRYLAFV